MCIFGCAWWDDMDPQLQRAVVAFCYCVNTDLRSAIDARIGELRKTVREQRALGKAIGYISVPISSLDGSHFGVNIDAAEDVRMPLERRLAYL